MTSEAADRLWTETSKVGNVNSEVENSRKSLEGAGWHCRQRGAFEDLLQERRNSVPPNLRVVDSAFGWFKPRVLWQSRNDVIAHYISNPVNDERRRWVSAQRERQGIPGNFVIDRSGDLDEFKFLVVGDPGEGDRSQFASVPLLNTVGEDTAFMIICSDVVYPAGVVNDYLHKFYLPYISYGKPIYAIPGNHDWYDGLNGFMVHFCGSEPSRRSLGSNRLVRRIWRKAAQVRPEVLEYCRNLRPELEPELRQPGPYFAIDTARVRLIGIDTGITGEIDGEQAEWLHEVSSNAPEKPKVLLTGKPIYVNGEYHPGKIEKSRTTVDQIVRERKHKYVAVIGGDIHNYQRYPTKVGDRTIQYVVSGGGGAYTSATHTIPRVGLLGLDEREFRCYPLRGDSLSFYSKLYDRKYASGSGEYFIEPDQAAAYMAERLGITPTRERDRKAVVTERTRLVAEEVFPTSSRRPSIRRYFFSRSGVRRGVLQHFYFSEFFDWDAPPFFKSFLQVEVAADKLTIACYAATGCKEHEDDIRVEDSVEIPIG